MTNNDDKYEKYLEQIKSKDKKSFILFSIIFISLIIFISVLTFNTIGKVSKTIHTQDQEIQIREDLLMTKDSILQTIKNDVKKAYSEIDTSKIDSKSLKSFKNVWDNVIKYSENTNTLLKYYIHKNDDPNIERIIYDMDFYVTKSLIKNSEMKVNAIWYGDSVDTKKVKLLAKKLIETNNNFKLIKNFESKDNSSWQRKTIAIKFEDNLDSLPTIHNELDIEHILSKNK